MPTYEYRCRSCDHEMEVQQSFSDDPLETCPQCGGSLRKVYGNVGISFKGSGFYKNDARSSSGSTRSGSGSASSSSGSDGGSSSSDSTSSSSTDSGSSSAATSASSTSSSD